MKNIFILILISLLSTASFAQPGSGRPTDCFRHGDYKGGVLAAATDSASRQLACFNEFKSIDDIPDEKRRHPNMDIKHLDDLDPHCFNGRSIIGPGDGGL